MTSTDAELLLFEIQRDLLCPYKVKLFGAKPDLVDSFLCNGHVLLQVRLFSRYIEGIATNHVQRDASH